MLDPAQVVQTRIYHAMHAHARGWALTPLAGKRPIRRGWQNEPPPSIEMLIEWARQGNLGLRTGSASGVIVIDDDTEDGSAESTLGLPPTVTVITGSGKKHHYFKAPDNVRIQNSTSHLAPGVDVRAEGGQTVSTGSNHPDTGEPYVWAAGRSPEDIPLAEIPPHLLQRMVSTTSAPSCATAALSEQQHAALHWAAKLSLRQAIAELSRTREGKRNDTLNRVTFKLARLIPYGAIEQPTLEDQMQSAALAAGLPSDEATRTIASAVTAGLAKPIDPGEFYTTWSQSQRFPLTDTGNAERMAALAGQELRYCHAWRKWLVYEGLRWEPDEGAVLRLSKYISRSILEEASRTEDDEHRKKAIDWARRSESAERRMAMIKLCQGEDGVSVQQEHLDADPLLLNCRNGTIDLTTGELRPHSRADLITKVVSWDYKPERLTPLWDAFLLTILPNDQVRAFVQRAVGWSITGDVSEQVLFFLYGTGANGKSVFLNILLKLLGNDYAIQAAPDLLIAKRTESHPTELADLHGKRFVASTEVAADRSFNEVHIKSLTGGDRIRARRMREDFWEFTPTHHLWIAGNHKPRIRGTEEAIWRRMNLIPFAVTIPPEQRDGKLTQKLEAEMPGILAWAVQGCLEWQRIGLNPPETVSYATNQYRSEMDSIGRFLDEECIRGDHTLETPASDLYLGYTSWCASNGERQVTQQYFGQRMSAEGLDRKKRGTYRYIGIQLLRHGSTGYPR